MSKSTKIIVGVLGGFVVFIGLIIGLAFWATSGPVKAVESHLDLLKSGNIQAAYDATAKDFKTAVPLTDYQQFLIAYPAFKNYQSVSFSSREINNDQATLQGDIKAADGGKTPVEIKLVNENGAWRILSIQVKNTGIEVTQ
jgi:hypothetical protein